MPFLAVYPIATADLAQVDNSAELPLLLLGIVKDPEEEKREFSAVVDLR